MSATPFAARCVGKGCVAVESEGSGVDVRDEGRQRDPSRRNPCLDSSDTAERTSVVSLSQLPSNVARRLRYAALCRP